MSHNFFITIKIVTIIVYVAITILTFKYIFENWYSYFNCQRKQKVFRSALIAILIAPNFEFLITEGFGNNVFGMYSPPAFYGLLLYISAFFVSFGKLTGFGSGVFVVSIFPIILFSLVIYVAWKSLYHIFKSKYFIGLINIIQKTTKNIILIEVNNTKFRKLKLAISFILLSLVWVFLCFISFVGWLAFTKEGIFDNLIIFLIVVFVSVVALIVPIQLYRYFKEFRLDFMK